MMAEILATIQTVLCWGMAIFVVLVVLVGIHDFNAAKRHERHVKHQAWLQDQEMERSRAHWKNMDWRDQEALAVRLRQSERETLTRLWERDNGEWQWHECGKPPYECSCVDVDFAPEFRPGETDIEIE